MPARWRATVNRFVLVLALITAAPISTHAQTTEPPEPRSCQRSHEETGKCDTGMRSCDQRVIARLDAQCQRDQNDYRRDWDRATA
jgi:hypothetical protein